MTPFELAEPASLREAIALLSACASQPTPAPESTSAAETPVTETAAPASRNPRAIAAPMPDVPPVTSTRRPANHREAHAKDDGSCAASVLMDFSFEDQRTNWST